MKKPFDLSLYLVTDRQLSRGRSIKWIVQQAIKGGVSMVQLREKECDTKQFVKLAIDLKNILSPLNIPLIINDRIDVALASNADGVHIGQSDMPYDIARNILGPDKIIGLSVESIQEAKEANKMDVDYIGISPVFLTSTKTDTAQALGLEGVKEIASFTKHPTVGIGGMNKNTAAEVIKAGANGIAVVSAIVSAKDPEKASKELCEIIKNANKEK